MKACCFTACPSRRGRPLSDGESALHVALGETTKPLTRLSPLVRALRAAWDDELQVHIYAGQPGLADPLTTLQRLEPALRPIEETS